MTDFDQSLDIFAGGSSDDDDELMMNAGNEGRVLNFSLPFGEDDFLNGQFSGDHLESSTSSGNESGNRLHPPLHLEGSDGEESSDLKKSDEEEPQPPAADRPASTATQSVIGNVLRSPSYQRKKTTRAIPWDELPTQVYPQLDEYDNRTRVVRFQQDEEEAGVSPSPQMLPPDLLVEEPMEELCPTNSILTSPRAKSKRGALTFLPPQRSRRRGGKVSSLGVVQHSDSSSTVSDITPTEATSMTTSTTALENTMSLRILDIFDEGSESQHHSFSQNNNESSLDLYNDEFDSDDDFSISSMDKEEEQEKQIKRSILYAIGGVGLFAVLGMGFKKLLSCLGGGENEHEEAGAELAVDAVDDAMAVSAQVGSDAATQASLHASHSSNIAAASAVGGQANAGAAGAAQ